MVAFAETAFKHTAKVCFLVKKFAGVRKMNDNLTRFGSRACIAALPAMTAQSVPVLSPFPVFVKYLSQCTRIQSQRTSCYFFLIIFWSQKP